MHNGSMDLVDPPSKIDWIIFEHSDINNIASQMDITSDSGKKMYNIEL